MKGLKLVSEYPENEEIRDILEFEGMHYFKIKFIGGDELKSKSYSIIAKNIVNGKIVSDSILFDSKEFGIKQLETVDDTILSFRVLAKKTPQNKLKIAFSFPRVVVNREFDAIDTEDEYSLRNIADESNLEIGYGKNFCLLAFILPYDMGNGVKSYCEVGSSGKDIYNWGEKFNLPHYILFEMKIE